MAVGPIEVVLVAQRFCAGQNLPFKVVGIQSPARRGQIEQETRPQRHVGDNELTGGRLREQGAIHQQAWHERFGLDGRQPEPINQALLVEPLNFIAKRQEGVALQFAHPVVRLPLE